MKDFFAKYSVLFVVLGILVVIGFWSVSSYNTLVAVREGVDTQWSQVETQYQRRFDLIPNLVSSVSAYMQQEKDVFKAIADARQGYAGARTPDDKVEATGRMESALGRLLVVMEAYPVLKSNETVMSLMSQLEGTENRVSVERMRYNDMVKDYNVRVKSFPGNLFAKVFGFDVKKQFQSEQGAEKAPKVQFNNR
jgi:LemA protein